jgi:hypothetical protein
VSDKKEPGRRQTPSRTLVGVVLIAGAVLLAVTVYNNLGSQARAVVTGAFCILGVLVTIVMLVVLIRQSGGGGW